MSKGSRQHNFSGNNGSGMSKHRTSGVAHNHAISIAKAREYNKELEAERLLKAKKKPKMYESVKELLKIN